MVAPTAKDLVDFYETEGALHRSSYSAENYVVNAWEVFLNDTSDLQCCLSVDKTLLNTAGYFQQS